MKKSASSNNSERGDLLPGAPTRCWKSEILNHSGMLGCALLLNAGFAFVVLLLLK